MDPELQKLQEGPAYNSDGADDTDETLKDLRANRGDVPKEVANEPINTGSDAPSETESDEAGDGKDEGGDEGKSSEDVKGEEPAKPAVKAEEKPKEEEADKGHMIPKARYDSLRARMDALEEQMRAPKKEEAKADPVKEIDDKLTALDEPMSKALADGDMPKYKDLKQQERALLREQARIEASTSATKVTTESFDQDKYDRAVNLLESSFPALNPDQEGFNEALTNQLGELAEAFQARGYSRFEALRKAVSAMEMPIRATLPPPKEEVKEPEEPPEDLKAKKEEERKAAAVKKSVEAAKAQPANTAKTGQDADKKGIKNGVPSAQNMTDEELEALPAETLKRMRGDFNVRART